MEHTNASYSSAHRDLFSNMEIESNAVRNKQNGCHLKRTHVITLVACAMGALLIAGLLGTQFSKSTSCSSGLNETEEEINAPIKKHVRRLPSSLRPLHYQLWIKPYMQPSELTYDGNVTILLWSEQSSSKILLNSIDLTIKSVRVSRLADVSPAWFEYAGTSDMALVPTVQLDNLLQLSQLQVKNQDIDRRNETIELTVEPALEPKRAYLLNIEFFGKITNILSGFYYSTYVNKAGQKVYIGMTQFQATDARRAFPCWDEPAFKATFDIFITHWRNHTALANMPTSSITPIFNSSENGLWTESRFRRTLRMSTYLLAWAIGEIAPLRSEDGKFSIWSRPAVINSAARALDLGPKVLRFYEQFFGITYPLPKTDMLAAPDFNAGAMENWGLVTYRETLLLYEQKYGRPLDLYYVSSVVAHELAHQWFGNLVTMDWWDDLWLNEGFATYMTYEVLAALHPEWSVMHDLQASEQQSVMRLDGLQSSHAISVPVNHPNEISELFDHISYSKGASIIHMMVNFLGREQFRSGVSAYLQARAFANAKQDDLWKYLTLAASGEIPIVPKQPVVPIFGQVEKYPQSKKPVIMDVKKVMDSWTLKKGFPLIHVKRDYQANTASFTQERFRLPHQKVEESKEDLWEVPITYTTAKEKQWEPITRLWLHGVQNNSSNQQVIYEIKNLTNKNSWFIVNLKQTGFYRVHYDEKNWQLLINQLQEDHKAIHEQSRAQLLDDLFALAETGHVQYSMVLKTVINYLPKENEALPWRTALGALNQIATQLQRTSLYGLWNEYMQDLIEPLYAKLSFDPIGEEYLQQSELQSAGLASACQFRVGDCVSKANAMFQSLMLNITQRDKNDNRTEAELIVASEIPPNVRALVYCMGVQQGDQKEWKFVWKAFSLAQVPAERERLLQSLKCTRVPWLLVRLLDAAFSENGGVRKQDGISVFRAIASQEHGRDIAFQYLRRNWDKIRKRYGKSFFSFGRMVSSISGVNSEFELVQMLDFYKTTREQVGSAQRAFQQAIETIQSNVFWMKTYYPHVQKFLKDQYPVIAATLPID